MTSDTCNVEKHLKNAMMTPVWPYVGPGVILKILNFLGFPRNFIFCKTGLKVFAYFTGVFSHYWGIIIHQTKPTSSGYQEVKGFWDPSTYSWENGYITILGNFGTHCRFREIAPTRILDLNRPPRSTKTCYKTGFQTKTFAESLKWLRKNSPDTTISTTPSLTAFQSCSRCLSSLIG